MMILQRDRGSEHGLEISGLTETAEYLPSMLAYCRLPFIPEREIAEIDNERHIFYRTTGLLPLKDIWKDEAPDPNKMENLLRSLKTAVGQLEGYMMPPEYILLHPAYVFTDAAGNIYFLYVPGLEGSFEGHLREFCQETLRLFSSTDREKLRGIYRFCSPVLEKPSCFWDMDFLSSGPMHFAEEVAEMSSVSLSGGGRVPGRFRGKTEEIRAKPYEESDGKTLHRRKYKRNTVGRARPAEQSRLKEGRRTAKRRSRVPGRAQLNAIMRAAAAESEEEYSRFIPENEKNRLTGDRKDVSLSEPYDVGTGVLMRDPSRPVTKLIPKELKWVEEIRIGEGTGTLGRQKNCCRYVLQVPGVSREHAELRKEGNRVWIMDMGSTNGTWLNRRRLPAGTEEVLRPGDEVCIANILFQVE